MAPSPSPSPSALALPEHAELMALSHFSFQVGASHPEELVARAHALGYCALALTDEATVAGVVRAHAEARRCGLKLLPGASFALPPVEPALPHGAGEGWTLVALPRHLDGWGALCRFITTARAAAPKGQYRAHWPRPDAPFLPGCECIWVPPRPTGEADFLQYSIAISAYLSCASAVFCSKNESSWLGVVLHQSMDDDWWLQQLSAWSAQTGLPLVALGGARMHARPRKPLHDVLTAIRLRRPVAQCGHALLPNAQAHLRTRLQLARVYPPELLQATVALASRCRFSLDALRYRYPRETLGPGETPAQTLARLTWAGARHRYGADAAVPDAVRQQLQHELALIQELGYEMYFLTVADLVRFARSRDILCQGRGSAANSAVCYCLGVTEVDPACSTLLFERFISRERNEPPDIDVDFEHQRREEVIQYLYAKYGRDRAALAATVISYRPRSALRDVGRALGVPEALIRAMAREHPGLYSHTLWPERLDSALQQLPPDAPRPDAATLAHWLGLSQQLLGAPRHLSQHVGGFVLTDGPLIDLVPIEPAAMAGRSLIQWDKDDLDAVGLLKVDVLALGMLSALRRALDLLPPAALDLARPHTRSASGRLTLAAIPPEDPETYRMVAAADTVGVFQIESRAQMSMLPRLRPACFYDLVVQVAIVRPGPIQGGMVHPYLRRRHGLEPADTPTPELQQALGRTLGVPIFQEQVMQVAMLCAGFTADEADSLRRAMAAWKRKGGVQRFRDRVVGGMQARGYPAAFAEQIFAQLEGFGEYGFPESHAASFAGLVYASAWIKRHHPAVFLAALLNSQPMGFYTPSQLVQDARRHGVPVRPVDVRHSHVDCTLEGDAPAVRLGLRLVNGLGDAVAQRIHQAGQRLWATEQRVWASVDELARHAQLNATALDALAAADALHGLHGHRRQQVWAAAAALPLPGLFATTACPAEPPPAAPAEPPLDWPAPTLAQDVCADWASTGLSLRAHPLQLLRPALAERRLATAAELASAPSRRLVRACGLVTVRQRPGTAKGVTFVTLEDETGSVNVVVWSALAQRQRCELLHARLLAVYGVWQRDDDTGGRVTHLLARRLVDLTPLLGTLQASSRDFH